MHTQIDFVRVYVRVYMSVYLLLSKLDWLFAINVLSYYLSLVHKSVFLFIYVAGLIGRIFKH